MKTAAVVALCLLSAQILMVSQVSAGDNFGLMWNTELSGVWPDDAYDRSGADGDLACFLRGRYLIVQDISNPNFPQEMSRYYLPDSPMGMDVVGDVAYLAMGGSGGLIILSLTDPANPQLASWYHKDDTCYAVSVQGGKAYLALGQQGFAILDVSDPWHPILEGNLGRAAFEGKSVANVTAEGNHALVTLGQYGLVIIDITNPDLPQIESHLDVFNWTEEVVAKGTYAYVADSQQGLVVINYSNPSSPQLATVFDPDDNPREVSLDGSTLIMGASHGLYILDISQPATPVQVGFFAKDYGLNDVTLQGNTIFGSYSDGLRVVDIANPAVPLLMRFKPAYGWITDMVKVRNYGFTGHLNDGVTVLNLADLSMPTAIAHMDNGHRVNCVDVYNNVLFAGGDDGLEMWDVTNPGTPLWLGMYTTDTSVMDVRVFGSEAYLAASGGGLVILDISQPGQPSLLGTYVTPDGADGVALSGNYAFVGCRTQGLRVIDVSNPSLPFETGSCSCRGRAGKVQVVGTTAYLAAGDVGLHILNIANPSAPSLLSTYGGGIDINNVMVTDGYAFVTHGRGMRVLSVDDPHAVAAVGYLDGSSFEAVTADAENIYVGGGFDSALNVIHNNLLPVGASRVTLDLQPESDSITMPFGPGSFHFEAAVVNADDVDINAHLLVEAIDPQGGVQTVRVLADDVFAAHSTTYGKSFKQHVPHDSMGGVWTYRVSLVASGESTVLASDEFTFFKLQILGEAVGDGGWELEGEMAASEKAVNSPVALTVAVSPNPFNALTSISYNLASPAKVNLSVFDIMGRLVRTLVVDQEQAEGLHVQNWDGRDQSGSPVASGLYLIRLKRGQVVTDSRAMLVK